MKTAKRNEAAESRAQAAERVDVIAALGFEPENRNEPGDCYPWTTSEARGWLREKGVAPVKSWRERLS